jgi:myosin-1
MQLVISAEREISVASVKHISTSVYRDDWFSIRASPDQPDPLLNCLLKTEFFTHLSKAMRGSLNIKFADT